MDYSVNLNKEQIEAVLNKYIAYNFDFELEYQNEFEYYDYTDNDVNVFKNMTISELASKIEEGQDPNLFLEKEDHILSSFYKNTKGMRLSDISDEGLLFVNYLRRVKGKPEIQGGKKSNRSKKSQKERKVQKSRKERKVKSKKSRKAKKTRKSRK